MLHLLASAFILLSYESPTAAVAKQAVLRYVEPLLIALVPRRGCRLCAMHSDSRSSTCSTQTQARRVNEKRVDCARARASQSPRPRGVKDIVPAT